MTDLTARRPDAAAIELEARRMRAQLLTDGIGRLRRQVRTALGRPATPQA